MCSVTYLQQPGRSLLTMNRDERHERAAERPPEVVSGVSAELAIVCPFDGETQGTWIAANELGLMACILNGYRDLDRQARVGGERHRSRGGIVPMLLRRGGFAEAIAWLRNDFSPAGYPSFTLVVADGAKVVTARWEGEGELTLEWSEAGPAMFWTSSSWRAEEVLSWREREFEKWLGRGAPSAGELPEIHLLQPSGMAEWSPLMHRSYSATRSITQIARVDEARIEIRYWGRPSIASVEPDCRVSMAVIRP